MPERTIVKAHLFSSWLLGEYTPEQPFYSINALPKKISNAS
jgi:hypothetical protein